MSAFSSPPLDNLDDNETQLVLLKQLKDEAIELEGNKQFEEANEKYEKLLTAQQAINHPGTMETMMSIDRVIEELKNKDARVSRTMSRTPLRHAMMTVDMRTR